jgi:hypothetical protein
MHVCGVCRIIQAEAWCIGVRTTCNLCGMFVHACSARLQLLFYLMCRSGALSWRVCAVHVHGLQCTAGQLSVPSLLQIVGSGRWGVGAALSCA